MADANGCVYILLAEARMKPELIGFLGYDGIQGLDLYFKPFNEKSCPPRVLFPPE